MCLTFERDFLSTITSCITSDSKSFSGLKLSSLVCDFAQLKRLSSRIKVFLAKVSINPIYSLDSSSSVVLKFSISSSEKPVIP